jgi:hypothetical protein
MVDLNRRTHLVLVHREIGADPEGVANERGHDQETEHARWFV